MALRGSRTQSAPTTAPTFGVAVRRPSGRTISTALTASAARASSAPKPAGSQRASQWQLDALAYYDQIGVVRYAAQFWARSLAKIRWYVGVKDEHGEITESEDLQAQAILDRVQDPQGGRTMILSTYGQLRFLTGECYLIWTKEKQDEPEAWEIVSTLELRKQSRRGGREVWTRIKAPGLTPQELFEADDDDFEPVGDEVVVYRFWRRHPAYSMMADAPMRSVLAECEEIVRSTQTINARLISRMSGPGLFVIPHEWSGKPLQQVVHEENPEEDPLQKELTDAIMTAIGNPGSAESVAPIILRVPGDTVDKGKLYKIWDPSETIREVELREKAVHRFAMGVDQPPSKVEGIEGTNHWNAWAVDEEGWEHVDPVAQEFADDLGGAYLRPAAKAEGVQNWENLVVAYDPSGILTNPDSFADAIAMYKERVVGKAYVRAAGNASDDDAMTDAELEEAIFVVTGQRVSVSGETVEVPTGEPPTGEDTEREAPEEPQQEDVQGDGLSALTYRVLGAAEVGLEEVRARAGARLRSHVQGREPYASDIRPVRNGEVAATIGPEALVDLEASSTMQLCEGAASAFVGAIERWGIPESQARALGEVLELHAARTLFDREPSLPAGFVGRIEKVELRA